MFIWIIAWTDWSISLVLQEYVQRKTDS